MKKIILIFVLNILCFLNAPILNAGQVEKTHIESIMLDQIYPDKLYIKADKPSVGSCSNSKWSFVMEVKTTTQKRIYANLHLAYTLGKPVSLYGNDDCTSVHSNIEELRRIELL